MHLKMSLNLVELKQNLAFYKNMGFSQLYIDEVKRDLTIREQKYAQLLLASTIQ